ncbi:MAG TPA: HlyD family efflux transporter periplasmic adaptor subunit [Candidatus Paceibacterota bacterium]|nr:HlyD family efflux transporter periplasmic adaptor subunit [Candidatus Paceibacterota bacterium]
MTKTHSRKTWIITGVASLAIAAVAGFSIYWLMNAHSVYIDSASVKADVISLAPSTSGTLESVYVNEGDQVPANYTVARVGDQLIQTKVAGIITSVPNTVGAQINAGQMVVAMIDPTQLRIVGQLDENKGLSRVQIGDPVTFTVDAFGSKKYAGVVDEVAPTANSAGVVFNISNQRETQQFDVKARFDTNAYPELKNGMSARMWVTTQ